MKEHLPNWKPCNDCGELTANIATFNEERLVWYGHRDPLDYLALLIGTIKAVNKWICKDCMMDRISTGGLVVR